MTGRRWSLRVPKTEKAWQAWLLDRGISERSTVILYDRVAGKVLATRAVRDPDGAMIVAV